MCACVCMCVWVCVGGASIFEILRRGKERERERKTYRQTQTDRERERERGRERESDKERERERECVCLGCIRNFMLASFIQQMTCKELQIPHKQSGVPLFFCVLDTSEALHTFISTHIKRKES